MQKFVKAVIRGYNRCEGGGGGEGKKKISAIFFPLELQLFLEKKKFNVYIVFRNLIRCDMMNFLND